MKVICYFALFKLEENVKSKNLKVILFTIIWKKGTDIADCVYLFS